MEQQFNQQHGAKSRNFKADDLVYARDYRRGYPRWSPARVQLRIGHAIYEVLLDGQTWRRHINQLRPRQCPAAADQLHTMFELPLLPVLKKPTDTQPEADRNQGPPDTQGNAQLPAVPAPAAPLRRTRRTSRRPKQLVLDPHSKTYATRRPS